MRWRNTRSGRTGAATADPAPDEFTVVATGGVLIHPALTEQAAAG